MSIIEYIKNAFLRAIGRKVERKIDRAVDKAVDKVVDKAYESNSTQETKETVKATEEMSGEKVSDRERKLAEIMLAKQAQYNQATTVNAVQGSQLNMAQTNEILNNLVFDDDMKVVGVKENAPDWMKDAYKKGAFDMKD